MATLDLHMYLRSFMELFMVIPAAAMAIIPVRSFRRVNLNFIVTISIVIFSVFLFGGAFLGTVFEQRTNIILFPFMLIFYAVYHFSFDLSTSKKIFCFLNASMLTGFSTMYSIFVSAPIEIGNNGHVLYLRSSLICLGISLIVTAVFGRTLAVKLPDLLSNSSLDKIWRWLIMAPLFMTLMCMWMTPISPENTMVGRLRHVSMLALLLIPAVTWTLFQIEWWVMKRMNDNSELQRSYDILKLEEKRYANTMSALEEARNLRHDFRQHLLVINDLAKQGKTEELIGYIEPFLQTSSEKHRQHFKNYVLDAVASHYVELAEKQNTKLIWNIGLPEKLPFKLSDICALLGNLLENALNATSKLPEEKRQVTIAMGLKSDAVLVISVKNPFTGIIRKDKDGFPIAAAKDHGIGLKSISNTVKRYNGSISIDTDNGIFDVGLILNSPEI